VNGAVNHFNGTEVYIIIPFFDQQRTGEVHLQYEPALIRDGAERNYFFSIGKPFAFQSENPFSRLYTFLNPCFSM
jgi:hypothetical protein